MKATKTVVALGVISVAAAIAAPAALAEQGDWIIRGGATMVDPKSKNLSLDALVPTAYLQVDDKVGFGFNITYMLTNNWGVELLAALPFKHDVDLCAGGACGTIASVEHLPPTLSLQYHFLPDAGFRPYIGAGVNGTLFFSEEFNGVGKAALEDLGIPDAKLKLKESFGLAAQIGADVALGDKWFVNFDVRYIQIESDAKVSSGGTSAPLGKIKIDPMVYSIMIGTKF